MDSIGSLDSRAEADGPVVLPAPPTGAAQSPVDFYAEHDHDYSDAIGELIERIAQPDRRGRLAIIDDLGSITYGDFADRCARFAAGLVRAGIAAGDRVFLCLLDTIDWPTAFIGTLQAGAVPVCADTSLDAAAYEAMLRDSEARLLIVSRSLYPAFDGLLQRIDSLARVEISEAPLADGGDMTVLLALEGNAEAPSRLRVAEVCRLRDGIRSQRWFDSLALGRPLRADAIPVEVVTGFEADDDDFVLAASPAIRIEPTDRCLSTGRLCEPATLEQMLLPALAVGASVVLIAEDDSARAIRSRLKGTRPEHLEGKAPTLLFATGQDLHRLLADDGFPPLAGLPLRAIIVVDEADDGLVDAVAGRTGIPVIRAHPVHVEATEAVVDLEPALHLDVEPAPVEAPPLEAVTTPNGLVPPDDIDEPIAAPDPSTAPSCVYRPGRAPDSEPPEAASRTDDADRNQTGTRLPR